MKVEPSPKFEPPSGTNLSCAFVSPKTLRELNYEVYGDDEAQEPRIVPVDPLLVRIDGHNYLTMEADGCVQDTLYVPEGRDESLDAKGSAVLIADRETAQQHIRMLS